MAKVRRPAVQDYIDVDLIESAYGGRMPTKDEFIYDMREQWNNYFTEAEKQGKGSGHPGPISFIYYLQLSRVALVAQKDEVIPSKVKEGLLSGSAARRNIGFIRKLIEYEEREISILGGRR